MVQSIYIFYRIIKRIHCVSITTSIKLSNFMSLLEKTMFKKTFKSKIHPMFYNGPCSCMECNNSGEDKI